MPDCQTIPNIAIPLGKLELLILEKLIPAGIGGRNVTDDFRHLFALPIHLGVWV